MTAPGITVVVLTYNEEDNISNCLQHLTWADRLVLVDSGSTDRTVEYAKEFGCDVYQNRWPGFAAQRNWSMDHANITTEWVQFIEADEEVTPAMRREICRTLAVTECNAFYICYKVMLFGRWVKRSSNFPVWHPRIVRLGRVRFKDAITGHGETWYVEGRVGYIREPYIHYSFSKGLDFWFEKHNRLSAMECTAFFANNKPFFSRVRDLATGDPHKRRQALRGLSYYLPFRPLFRLLHQLIIKGGILDGPAGWTYCAVYFAYEIMISAKIKQMRYLEQNGAAAQKGL